MVLLSSLAISLSSCVSCALSEGFVKRDSCFTDEPLERPKYTNRNFVPFYVLVITLSEHHFCRINLPKDDSLITFEDNRMEI